jgi:alpha-ketoglutarate-dependent taurine dioxygenase
MDCVALHPFGHMLRVTPSTPFADVSAAAAQLVDRHWLVILRGREMSEAEHLDLMRVFGKPSPFAFASNDPARGAVVGTSGWHTDGPYVAGSALVGYSHMGLYCVESPRSVPTSFLSTPSFLDRSSTELSSALRELDGISVLAPHYNPESRDFHLADPRFKTVTLSNWQHRYEYRHPLVVRVGDVTGLNMHMGRLRGFVRRGAPLTQRLDTSQTKRVFGLLHDAMDKTIDAYEHDWLEHDLALVDNRLVAHLGHPSAGTAADVIGRRVLRRAMAEMREERPWRLCRTPPPPPLRTKLKRSAGAILRATRQLLRRALPRS